MTDRYDGCYNCKKRTGRICPKYPKGIQGLGPCEDHELASPRDAAKEIERVQSESAKGEMHGCTGSS